MGPYEEILHALATRGIEFIVGGGVACVLHGVERVTMDVDVAVQMRPDNLLKFIDAMDSLGLRPRVPIAPALLLDPAVIRLMVEEKQALVFSFVDPDRPFRHLDMFLRSDLSYDSLLSDSEWKSLGSVEVRVINRPRMLAIKLAINPPRLKDRLDIEFLSRNENN